VTASDLTFRSIPRDESGKTTAPADIRAAAPTSPLAAAREMAAIEAAAFDEPWSAAALAEIWAEPGARGWLAQNPAGEVLGFALFRVVAAAREAELLRVATVPAWRRRGVAAGLLGFALAELDRAAIDCFLEVRADNLPAQELYRRFGFVRVQIRPAYYRDGCDAWVLARPA
jgi:[ribosomal protein S18]-alanine N-acetyltransferase